MKYKTLFRLLLKLLGVMFFFQGIEHICWFVAPLIQSLWSQNFSTVYSYPSVWAQLGGAALMPIVGLYLFFRGNWIIDRAIPSNRPYCPECGYDLTNLASSRCPECGIALPGAKGLTIPMGTTEVLPEKRQEP